ncbi:hypothetical protein SAMN04489727_7923 [Amycolatopsis tolypomycina]|uniref:Uncharacterized protein n=1 Tax=Amycolatopsis tolypomycina TaxID=208445 RepID=A0A1H5ASB6_9PSEU|nr:hypothetical protein [Amycolatopsis tolypomycina]SED45152.1 hypothetical protein SAMN04489727_7923 [Amycolatopsis tolypomycina]
MTSTTAPGAAEAIACGESTSVMDACARRASNRSAAGGIAWSRVATRAYFRMPAGAVAVTFSGR